MGRALPGGSGERAQERVCREAVRIGMGQYRAAEGGFACLEGNEADPGAANRSVTVSGSSAKPTPAATARSTCSTRFRHLYERRREPGAVAHRDDRVVERGADLTRCATGEDG